MICKDFRINVEKYTANNLDTKTSLEMEEHIKSCSECKTYYIQEKYLFAKDTSIKAPNNFTMSVMNVINTKIKNHEYKSISWNPLYRRLGYSLVITAIVFIFTLVNPQTINLVTKISKAVEFQTSNKQSNLFMDGIHELNDSNLFDIEQ